MDAQNQVPIVFSPRSGVWIILLILCTACAARQVPSTNQEPVSGSQATQEVVIPAAIQPTFTPSTENPSATVVEENPPTSRNSSSEGSFSLDEMQREKPTDMLRRQLVYWVGGGAGDWCPPSRNYELVICPDNSIEPYQFGLLSLGGLTAGDQSVLTIFDPEGQPIRTIDLTADNQGSVKYKFIPTLSDPLGVYSVSFKTPRGIVPNSFEIVESDRPRLVVIPEEDQVVLFGFVPDESLRLYLYGRMDSTFSDISLLGWQAYQVDGHGQLSLAIPVDIDPLFVAVGDRSGAVYKEESGAQAHNKDWVGSDVFCPAALAPQKIDLGSFVKVDLPDVPLQKGDPGGETFQILDEGSLIQVSSTWWFSPVCEAGTYWYAIDCQSVQGVDCTGNPTLWVPEIVGEDYALQVIDPAAQAPPQTGNLPTESQPAGQSWPVSETGQEACHLSNGDVVHAGDQARLWPQPDATVGKFLTNLAVGTPARVIGGPEWGGLIKGNNLMGWWYQVEVESLGNRGWVWQARLAECGQ